MKKVSVVIPMYNSSQTIAAVADEIRLEFERLKRFEYEIVLVNDCSPDNVVDIAKQLAGKDKRIKVVNLAKNSGQTNAMFAGYYYAQGDYIVNMDDDLQQPGSEIGKLIDALEERDLDVVFAKYKQQKESRFRLWGSNLNAKMAEIMVGKPKNIRTNSFFVMRKFVRDAILRYDCNYPYIFGIIFAVTSHVGNAEVIHRERTVGSSNYNLKKLIGLWMNGFLSFSIKPLRLATTGGFIISAVSAVIAVILLIQRLLMPTLSVGWTSLIITIIFFSGIQLIGIGVLGEYLGRMFISQSKLPTYVVRDLTNIDKEGKEND